MRRRTVSHVEAARRGWKRVDPRPWSTLNARWHFLRAPFVGPQLKLEHCGHPTAHRPWALVRETETTRELLGAFATLADGMDAAAPHAAQLERRASELIVEVDER